MRTLANLALREGNPRYDDRSMARVAVRAQLHSHAGTADIRDYQERCQSRSCNPELAQGWKANYKSRYQLWPMGRST
jgi:hypothetical protein